MINAINRIVTETNKIRKSILYIALFRADFFRLLLPIIKIDKDFGSVLGHISIIRLHTPLTCVSSQPRTAVQIRRYRFTIG